MAHILFIVNLLFVSRQLLPVLQESEEEAEPPAGDRAEQSGSAGQSGAYK